MRSLLVTSVLCATLVGLTPQAAAPAAQNWRTFQLNWRESNAGTGRPLITFTVAWLKVDGDRWQIRGSFTNRSKVTLKIEAGIVAYGPGASWGFGIYAPRVVGAVATKAFARPAMPTRLRPGASWSGIYGGTGVRTLPRHEQLSLTFGHFVDQRNAGFSWVSQHSIVL
jgi:hypothetical protein